MGSTSFLGFSYPNLLLVFLNLLFFRNLYHIFLAASVGTSSGSFLFYRYFSVPYFGLASRARCISLPLQPFEKQKQTKTSIVGRNRTTVNAIVRVSIRLRNFGALRERGFIHAPGLPMGSKPWLACACVRKKRPRAPGEKASADLKKLQQILTMVQLSSNSRDN